MKPQAINREILLLTGTSFINRPFCQKDNDGNKDRHYSCIEELEHACWDGILNELLPELVGHAAYNNNYIWNTVSGVNFLYISMGPCPVTIEKKTSLDPYRFLSFSYYN